MKRKERAFNVFVIVLTLCLAAILAIIITHKVKSKKDNSKETDITAFSINVIDMETSVQETETEAEMMSDASWEDMLFVLSGVEYKLPLDVKELASHGWKGFPEGEVEPGEKIYFEVSNGNAAVKGYCCNPGDSAVSVGECKIIDIKFTWANAIFPQNIEIMKSTINDVYEKYGKPIYEDESGKVVYEKINYEGGFEALIDENRPGIEFFYNEDGLIVYVGLYCGNIDKEAE